MKIKFKGVRGSIPTPGPTTVKYGGNTTCLEVITQHGEEYIFDAGSGIRELGNELMGKYRGKVNAKIFITHDHWDHIQGFPFFVPAYVPGCKIDVYSGNKELAKTLNDQQKKADTGKYDKKTLELMLNGKKSVTNKEEGTNHTKQIFSGQQDRAKGYFPVTVQDMNSELTFHDLKEYEVLGNGTTVSAMCHNAHPGGMFAYKIQENGKTLVNTGDYEHDGTGSGDYGINDKKIIEWAKNADVLIADAQYTPEEYEKKRGWGHSQIERICEIAAAANAKKLYITHHDPMHSDEKVDEMEARSQRYMKDVMKLDMPVVYAREGMEIEL